jgi:uroporphyrinogen decarboxylase
MSTGGRRTTGRETLDRFPEKSRPRLSSRERVLAALLHEMPDRTPCDFWAEPTTMNRLFAHLGHSDRDRLLDHLGVDVRHLEAAAPPEQLVVPGIYQNYWGERFVWQHTPWGPMRQDVQGALADATSVAELEAFPWPNPGCIDRSTLLEQARRYENYALLYGFADVWQRPALVRGWGKFFIDMAERPQWAHFLCRKFTDFYLEDYTRAAEITGGRIDLYLLISDLGSQRGPLISIPMFHQFVAPYLKEMIDRIHHLGGRVLYHSCGAIRPFIHELIGLGIDVLDPIQPAGLGMQPESLKAEFGDRLCFHGGIDMQHILPTATPDQVRAEAQRYCEVLGSNGGYILAPAHLFQPDVPPENVLAMYHAEWPAGASARRPHGGCAAIRASAARKVE